MFSPRNRQPATNALKPRRQLTALVAGISVSAGAIAHLSGCRDRDVGAPPPPTYGTNTTPPNPMEALSLPPRSGVLSPEQQRLIVEAQRFRDQSSRAWNAQLGMTRVASEEAASRISIAKEETSRSLAVAREATYRAQSAGTLGSPGRAGEHLAGSMTRIAMGAQRASSSATVATVRTSGQIHIQSDRSLSDIIRHTAVTPDHLIQAGAIIAGVPPIPTPSQPRGSSSPTDSPPATDVSAPDRERRRDAETNQVSVVTGVAGAHSTPARGPASTPEVQPKQVAQSSKTNEPPKVIEANPAGGLLTLKGAGMAAAGYVAGKVGEELLDSYPWLNKMKCKTEAYIRRATDALTCPPYAVVPLGVVPSEQLLEQAEECRERGNFELKESLEACDHEYHAAQKQQAEQERRFQAERARKKSDPPNTPKAND